MIPIPEDRFPMEIAPGIHVLGNYFFNLFLVLGTLRTVIFETGVSGVVDRVTDQLESLGVVPDDIIVSHPHSDHITGLPGLRKKFPKARIMAGSGAHEFITHPKAGPALIKEDRFISQSLEALGITPGRPSLDRIPDLTGHTPVTDTTRIDLGGKRELVLMPVQGHAPGNLIAWVPDAGALFCSDSLGFHYPGRGFWPLFFTGAAPYLSALETMEALSPKILCPAHQGPLFGADVKRAFTDSRSATAKMIERILNTDQDDDDLAQSLFEESYRDEFTLYTPDNIHNCSRLLIKRARET